MFENVYLKLSCLQTQSQTEIDYLYIKVSHAQMDYDYERMETDDSKQRGNLEILNLFLFYAAPVSTS